MALQNLSAKRVGLALPDHAATGHALDGQVESTDAREQRADSHATLLAR